MPTFAEVHPLVFATNTFEYIVLAPLIIPPTPVPVVIVLVVILLTVILAVAAGAAAKSVLSPNSAVVKALEATFGSVKVSEIVGFLGKIKSQAKIA